MLEEKDVMKEEDDMKLDGMRKLSFCLTATSRASTPSELVHLKSDIREGTFSNSWCGLKALCVECRLSYRLGNLMAAHDYEACYQVERNGILM
ncbi:hypothetical protein AVEN_156334-1 [Araneus ventricosus]|uniref:Uncharacterized protein n=1 Tax=Araneus ventricosus TaxID=182803 RepID=A0A4Y2Q2L0_ARAVE|nr:hypothetical protein AVEN_156334-1 [Araneus ventricosus]